MIDSRRIIAAGSAAAPYIAWAFALATLALLIGHIRTHWPIGDATTSMLVPITNDGTATTGFGFLYHGTVGAITLWTQTLLVIVACSLTLARPIRLQRTGHIVLVLWNALWAANAIYATVIGADGALTIYLPAAILTCLALACTAERARASLTSQAASDTGSAIPHAHSG